MADWKMPMSYNYNASYHAYAYGLMYPQTPEHGHQNLNWADAAYSHNGGVTGSFYSSQAAQQSPSWSPENAGANNYGQYQDNTQNGQLFTSCDKTELETKAKDTEQTESDTLSDSETHTPDSWSSVSSQEGPTLTDLNILPWKDQEYESDSCSPEVRELISNTLSVATDEPVSLNLGVVDLPPPMPPSNTVPERPAVQPRKTRAAFSEVQMNALIQRFNVQRYLTPAEMKTLAGSTGLTYKQVKTWFQNRRMKLKRHQRDSSWMNERYVINGAPNGPASHTQSDNHVPNKDYYSNNQPREPMFKRSPPQTQFYPSYSNPHPSPQPCNRAAMARPPANWPLPPAVMHYEFPNPTNYMQAHINVGVNAGMKDNISDSESQGNSPASIQMQSVAGATQWST